jgi:hypothetical protein
MLHARSLPSPTYTNPSFPSESFEHAKDPAERDGGVFVGEGRGWGSVCELHTTTDDRRTISRCWWSCSHAAN